VAPVRLNSVCFTVPGDVRTTIRAITTASEALVTYNVHEGEPAIRAAFSNWRTTTEDVDRVYDAVKQAVTG
jgi:hypothetical protein